VLRARRFLIAFTYRPIKDRGHRPTVTVIVPAFNEEEGIEGTIASIVNSDYPAHLLEIVVVNDGSTDDTWQRMVAARERWPQVHAIDLGANYGKRAAMAEGIAAPVGDPRFRGQRLLPGPRGADRTRGAVH
jgi:hyaluronan synthase